jgi:hypothetical protein
VIPPFPEWDLQQVSSEDWGSAEAPFVDSNGLPSLPDDIKERVSSWARPYEFIPKAVTSFLEATKAVKERVQEAERRAKARADERAGLKAKAAANQEPLPAPVVVVPPPVEEPEKVMDPTPIVLLPFPGLAVPDVAPPPPEEPVKEVKKGDKKGAKVEPVVVEAPKPIVPIDLPRVLHRRFLLPGDTGLDFLLGKTLTPPPKSALNLCSVFTLIASLPSEIPKDSFLWEGIYPKGPDGRPSISPSGKYVLRLYNQGSWRRVVVDDRIPVDLSGNPLFVNSEDPREIWPLLLAKGLVKLLDTSTFNAYEAFIALTGMICDPASTVQSQIFSRLTPSLPHISAPMPTRVIPEILDDDRRSKKKKHKKGSRSKSPVRDNAALTTQGVGVDAEVASAETNNTVPSGETPTSVDSVPIFAFIPSSNSDHAPIKAGSMYAIVQLDPTEGKVKLVGGDESMPNDYWVKFSDVLEECKPEAYILSPPSLFASSIVIDTRVKWKREATQYYDTPTPNIENTMVYMNPPSKLRESILCVEPDRNKGNTEGRRIFVSVIAPAIAILTVTYEPKFEVGANRDYTPIMKLSSREKYGSFLLPTDDRYVLRLNVKGDAGACVSFHSFATLGLLSDSDYLVTNNLAALSLADDKDTNATVKGAMQPMNANSFEVLSLCTFFLSQDETTVSAIFHIDTLGVDKFLQYHLVNNDDGHTVVVPSVKMLPKMLRVNSNGYSLNVTVSCTATPLPGGEWTLQILSDKPFKSIKKSLQAKTQLFGEGYIPNKYWICFEDVVESDDSWFNNPVGFRFSFSDAKASLKLQLVDKGKVDRPVVLQSQGFGNSFLSWTPPESYGEQGLPVGPFVIRGLVDFARWEDASTVSSAWPLYHISRQQLQAKNQGTETSLESTNSKFQWRLTTSSVSGIRLKRDDYREVEEASIRASWLAGNDAREEQAGEAIKLIADNAQSEKKHLTEDRRKVVENIPIVKPVYSGVTISQGGADSVAAILEQEAASRKDAYDEAKSVHSALSKARENEKASREEETKVIGVKVKEWWEGLRRERSKVWTDREALRAKLDATLIPDEPVEVETKKKK